MMKRIAMVALAASLVTACGDSGSADADGDGTITQEEMRAEMASAPDMQMRPGKWEQTMTITEFDIPGMPEEMKGMFEGQIGQTFTVSSCLTEEQVKQPEADFFGGEGQDDCEFQEFDRSGNTMSMRMTCSNMGGGTAKIAMEGEFGEEEYTLSMDNQVTGVQGMPGEGMSMKGTMKAKRVGDCAG